MKNVLKFLSLSALLMCCALFAGSVFAQSSTTGAIGGNVADQNGAPVANATVTASSVNLMGTKTSQTDSDGRYQILGLPPGNYTVVVEEQAGFGKVERADVVVNLSKTTTVDLTLTPKGAMAQVTVTDTGVAGYVKSRTFGKKKKKGQVLKIPTSPKGHGVFSIRPPLA